MLGQLTVHQKSIQEQFSQACNGKVPKGKNLPEFVNLIVYVRQLEAKVCPLSLLYCILSVKIYNDDKIWSILSGTYTLLFLFIFSNIIGCKLTNTNKVFIIDKLYCNRLNNTGFPCQKLLNKSIRVIISPDMTCSEFRGFRIIIKESHLDNKDPFIMKVLLLKKLLFLFFFVD